VHPLIDQKRIELAEICRRHRVKRLEVFGSGARGSDFDPERSDVDFLVEFEPSEGAPSLATFFELRDALSTRVGRSVDLVEAGSVRNPYVLAEIERSRELVYAP
jgi:predicted nucleotidyltransferase